MQKLYVIINEVSKSVDALGIERFSDQPFGFMQHNSSDMDNDELHVTMKHFYDHIFKSLWFNPEPTDTDYIKWSICTDEDNYIDLNPNDRFLIDHKKEQITIQRAPDFKDEQTVWYGEPARCFRNHSEWLMRKVRSNLPYVVSREEMYEYVTGCPDIDPIPHYIRQFQQCGNLVYRKGDSLLVYSKFDDKTMAEVALEEIKWRNRHAD